MDYTMHYESPLGGITMASDGEALCGLWFDGQKYFAAGLSQDHEEKELPIFPTDNSLAGRLFQRQGARLHTAIDHANDGISKNRLENHAVHPVWQDDDVW